MAGVKQPSISISHVASVGRVHPGIRTEDSGFGGFPMPHKLLFNGFGWLFPSLRMRLSRTLTIPATTLSSLRSHPNLPYVSFDAIVGRNSVFYGLTEEQIDELGGVEYRALNALLWIIPAVSLRAGFAKDA